MVIPRSALDIINKRSELQTPAFYILIGEDDLQRPIAYIGETENFAKRIKQHDNQKDFWQKAFVFISNANSITKADVQFLQYISIELANKTKQFNLSENKQNPNAPKLPEHQQSNIEEFFEDVKFLSLFAGCNIFDHAEQKGKHLFYAKSKGCKGVGFYDEKGFTVLKGSIISKEVVNTISWAAKRNSEVKDYTKEVGDYLSLKVDKTFNSPSSAAVFCLGRHSNGWSDWKDDKGNTLDEVYRKKIDK